MSVDPLHQQQLFEQALERQPEEREAFLDGACAGDRELRVRVSALLASLAAADDFLAEPASTPADADAQPGRVIDRYKLLQEIGEGGFGTVWMAEQLEPVRRKVALKVIKLGMDTRQVVARFEAERQALALMEHPGIAKVFDGGITPGGRPYFVMELIKGVPITEYCDKAQLDTPERLELFQRVCHAVQHAHQKGVIHRDLKPSNILVTLHDGAPVPKVIDFGIAKATSAELTQKTLFTEFRQMVGTPEYMAPEQAELSELDVDTRADLYSLGVVLYEMLTGTKPFDMKSLLEKGYLEMLRMIREDAPPKPSTRISTLGEQLAAVSRRRHATPASLSRLLHGDLDWIVMRALEKERSRRYVTANDFAADIGRHLQHEPVLACPPSALYRLSKFVRRHRLGVFASAAVLMALVAGLAVAAWGWWETEAQRVRAVEAEDTATDERDAANTSRELADAERHKAGTEAARAGAVIGLLEGMFGAASPVTSKGPNYTVRMLLEEFAEGIDDWPSSIDPEVEASVRSIVSAAYMDLGLLDEALSHARAALQERQAALGDEHLDVAASLFQVSWVLQHQQKFAEAEPLARRALAMRQALLGEEHSEVARSLDLLVLCLMQLGKVDEAEKLGRESIRMKSVLLPDECLEVAQSLNNLSQVMTSKGELTEAEDLQTRSNDMTRRLLGGDSLHVAIGLDNLGKIRNLKGRPADAEELLRESVAMRRRLFGNAHPEVAKGLSNLSAPLFQQQKLVEAEAASRESLAIWRGLFPEESAKIAGARGGLAKILAAQGNYREAVELLQKALATHRQLLGDGHALTATSMMDLVFVLMDYGKYEEAEPLAREAFDARLALYGDENADVAWSLDRLAGCLMGQGKHEKAEEQNRAALRIRRKVLGDKHHDVATSLNNLSVTLWYQGKLDEGEEKQRESIDMFRGLPGDERPSIAAGLDNLGKILVAQGRPAEGEQSLRESLDMRLDLFGEPNPQVAIGRWNLGDALLRQGKFLEAEPELQKSFALCRLYFGDASPTVVSQLGTVAAVLQLQEKHAEAEELLSGWLSGYRESGGNEGDPAFASALARLGMALLEQAKFSEAEPVLRECVEIRANQDPDSWLHYNTLSLLGAALLGQERYTEAETRLVEGHDEMKPPPVAAFRKTEALARVVELYESWGKPAEAATWRTKLELATAAAADKK